ncbi:MAG TPA: hypothetical protein VMK42_07380 [Anaeromyxobacteraceae bacterium]|nr:hypothetical protein [Anaeromyxobacteraceae bacterium]
MARAVWEAYCKSGRKPNHVPERPDILYAEAWTGWRDWLTWAGIEDQPSGAPPPQVPDERRAPAVEAVVPLAESLDGGEASSLSPAARRGASG